MKSVRREGKFRKDIKRVTKRGYGLGRLYVILDLLANDEPLPIALRLHRLTGEWQGYLECHIRPDWLLIYRVIENEIVLARTGTHADLLE
ncbi:damage-inducible protein [Candidatus Kaiserbacteria bacterium RIFCSPHIGHO2_01_FULL_53_29]|uniref:Damage-inducible protein n=1 Tax=Candidatus Kaiserbacteria bacterium RIFCSPHIGHO2_01_FULL_53_29 TaxID=1798480 RepID=A0A1F6CWA7_9BACT|nr:MAG: damage-inducible protein [Candidatus Kaiserbacteria bacterium RIFCSPHIGHO2_01_FULL_53_29]